MGSIEHALSPVRSKILAHQRKLPTIKNNEGSNRQYANSIRQEKKGSQKIIEKRQKVEDDQTSTHCQQDPFQASRYDYCSMHHLGYSKLWQEEGSCLQADPRLPITFRRQSL